MITVFSEIISQEYGYFNGFVGEIDTNITYRHFIILPRRIPQSLDTYTISLCTPSPSYQILEKKFNISRCNVDGLLIDIIIVKSFLDFYNFIEQKIRSIDDEVFLKQYKRFLKINNLD